ncbi:glutathione S-transferase [Methylomagnum ishizawai]|uniref:Glutathione S-transferase n=1 Tax=Methylomagnum ishizawai TaxID=1760988 RepID=A0A1Y6D4M3_9GAMM|nr:glutathione S-transferase family protein [Methylomagnum ishizawai]SMF95813.1 glutathione S-transferase [Methylomagnum ishizawai]
MKLYFHPASPFARKPRIVAHLLGLELETEFVDLFAGKGQVPEFLKLNPHGKVPTLVDGDFSLWESNAILQYLAAKQGDTALYPDDVKVRADIARWLFWESSSWSQVCMVYVNENILKPMLGRGEPDPAELAKVEEKFHRFAKVLDGHLAGRDWLVGDGITLADVSVAASLMYAVPGKYPLEGYANIARWFGQVQALPAWAATAPPAA